MMMYLRCSARSLREDVSAHPVAPSTSNMAKYSGLNKTAIASFHPRATKTPYIHIGICATDETMLRLASTYAASASRLKRVSRETSLVGDKRLKAVETSKEMGSASASNEGSG